MLEYNLKYRFVCENCGKETDWIETSVKQGGPQFRSGRRDIRGSRIPRHIKDPVGLQLSKEQLIQKNLEKTVKELQTKDDFIGEPFLAEQFNVTFAHHTCPVCSHEQSWYPAVSEMPNIKQSLKSSALAGLSISVIALMLVIPFYNLNHSTGESLRLFPLAMIPIFIAVLLGYFKTKRRLKMDDKRWNTVSVHNKPIVDWNLDKKEPSKDSVNIDILEENEIDFGGTVVVKQLKHGKNYTKTLIRNKDTSGLFIKHIFKKEEPTAFLQLANAKHLNLPNIYVTELNENVGFTIMEDYNDSVSLRDKMNAGMSFDDFNDCILQLCDVISFLGRQKPPVFLRSIDTNDIVVDDENVIILSGLSASAAHVGSNETSIAQIGEILKTADKKYRKEYKDIIKKCAGEYKKFDKLESDLISAARSRVLKIYAAIGMAVVSLFMFYRIFGRLFGSLKPVFSVFLDNL